MAKRLWCALACICTTWANSPLSGAELHAQLFPLTGEIRLLNKSDTDISFVFYSIDSPAGALLQSPQVWKSITTTYDSPLGATPGNGFIDPNGDWLKLSSTSLQLAEGALDVDGGALPAYRAITLGNIWDPYLMPFPDLVFDVQNDTNSIPVTIELALEGDYSNDHVVDIGDYLIWRKFLDSMTAYFADGDLDGVVDLDDYEVWQKNFGLTLPLPPFGFGSGAGGQLPAVGVPEPGSAILLLLAAGVCRLVYRQKRR